MYSISYKFLLHIAKAGLHPHAHDVRLHDGSLFGLWRRELFAVEGGHGLDRQAVRCEKNSIERITIAAITVLMSGLRLACMTSMAERPQIVQVERYHFVVDILRRELDDVVDFIARLAAYLTDASIHSYPQLSHISPGF